MYASPVIDLDGYELLDFGGGRRLERFGDAVLDRPAPAAEREAPRRIADWRAATARFLRAEEGAGGQRAGARQPTRPGATRAGATRAGGWTLERPLPEPWQVRLDGIVLEVRPTDSGGVGVFPEQVAVWRRLVRALPPQDAARAPAEDGPALARLPIVLNLFAHTGAGTLVGAAHGAALVHVDAARGTIAWARRNAELSSLGSAPIRWIPEDAVDFVHRELRRGRRYDGVILDPPSYGHAPGGRSWVIERDLPGLLRDCAELISGRRGFLIVSAHAAALDAATLGQELARAVDAAAAMRPALGRPFGRLETERLDLATSDGRRLPTGVLAAWTALR